MRKPKTLRRSPLRRVSKKRAADNVRYRKAKDEWRESRIEKDSYHRCEFVGQPFSGDVDDKGRCFFYAMEAPHHKKGRYGAMLYNKRYFFSACFFHHDWIESNKREARKRGYILYS